MPGTTALSSRPWRRTSIPWLTRDATSGRDEWRAYREEVRAGSPDFHNQIIDMVLQGDRAAVRLACTGHHHGPLLGIEATGRPFRYDAAAFLEAVAGRLAHASVLGDVAGLRSELSRPPTDAG